MARIDPERAHVVVRLVYDGAARAGKTTSLRQLARSLGVDLFSAAEEDGRTLYFDWLDYVGGLFEGMPIRCQVVSVPGQLVLETRRRSLLKSADAVVFVVDSQPQRAAENRRAYEILREIAARERVPIGIVVQANKRDVPDAVPLDEIRDLLGDGVAMTEAVAGRGEGVRETFVLAVRLALDRVRALANDGALEALPPDFENGAELLAAMMNVEGHAPPVLASVAEPNETTARDSSRLEPPDASIPPGLVWPPVNGRIVVHEAARDAIRLERDDSGSVRGVSGSGRWRLFSSADASFRDLEHGREALIAWARWHAAASPRLSAERAIVLAPAGDGEWRLWQIVRASHTLRDMCRDIVHQRGPAAGERLFEVLDLYAQAFDALVASGLVDGIALDEVTLSANGAPVFAGAAAYPVPQVPRERARRDESIADRDLFDALRTAIAAAPEGLSELLSGFEAAAARRGRAHLAESLRHGLLHS